MATQRLDLMLVTIFHKATIELGLNTMYSVLLHTINMLLRCQIMNRDDLQLSQGKASLQIALSSV